MAFHLPSCRVEFPGNDALQTREMMVQITKLKMLFGTNDGYEHPLKGTLKMGEDKSSWKFHSLGIQKCCPDDTQLCIFYHCSVMNTHSLTQNHISSNSRTKVTQHPVTIFGILSFGWIGTLKPICIWAQSLLQHWFRSMEHTQTICWIVYLLHVIRTLVPWEIVRPESMLCANEHEWTVAFNHLWTPGPSWVHLMEKLGLCY